MNLENLLAIAGQSSNSIPAGLIGALIGQFLPLSASEREQNAFNQRMAEDAYNRQIQFYENFQSPQSMVAQYKQAGINPALVSGYSPSTPPSSASASGSGGSPALGLIQLAMEMKLRNKELNIQRDLADAEIANKNANTRKQESETYRIDIGNTFAVAVESANLDKINASIDEIRQNIAKSESEVEINGEIFKKEQALAALANLQYLFENDTFDFRKNLSYWTSESVKADAQLKQARAARADEIVQKEISLQAAQAFLYNQEGKEIAKRIEQFYGRMTRADGSEIEGTSPFELLTTAQTREAYQHAENYIKNGDLLNAEKAYYEVLAKVTNPEDAHYWAGRAIDMIDMIGKFYVATAIGGRKMKPISSPTGGGYTYTPGAYTSGSR